METVKHIIIISQSETEDKYIYFVCVNILKYRMNHTVSHVQKRTISNNPSFYFICLKAL